MAQKIFIKTFGCQMNEYDSNRIYDSVKKIGYEKTENYEDANCYLDNYEHVPTIRRLCLVGGTIKRKLFPYHYTVERCQRRYA